jgi:hypothetical protein
MQTKAYWPGKGLARTLERTSRRVTPAAWVRETMVASRAALTVRMTLSMPQRRRPPAV